MNKTGMNHMDIPYLRLRSLGLLAAHFRTPAEVVDWLTAVQAQDFAGAKWSLGRRMLAAFETEVEQSFNEGAILRTHVLRPTWHFVLPADIGWLLDLTRQRVQATNATMYRKLGLDAGLLRRSADVLARALEGGRQLNRAELSAALEQAGISTQGELRLGYFLMNAELEGLICSGLRRGRQFTYALLAERAPQARRLDRPDALAWLARRFFTSRGPATAADFAKWSGLTLADARAGLEANRSALEQVDVNGETYWMAPVGPVKRDEAQRAWLLSVYDELISSYQDRSAIISREIGEKLWALGNALFYIIVVDGQVAGTWRRTLRAKEVVIKVDLFRALTAVERSALEEECLRYGEFLGLAVQVAGLA